MVDVINLDLARITFSIKYDKSFKLLDPGTAYQSFFWKIDGQSNQKPPDCQVHIQTGKFPNIEKKNKLFDSCQSWSMYETDNDYVILLHPSGFKQPIWLARVNHNLKEGTVYCGKTEIGKKNKDAFIPNPFRYPLDQILLMYILSQKNGALFHAAGIKINGKGYIFPGKSGAGKSTLTRQFAVRNRAKLISDDRMAVRKIDEEFTAYGTPWPGEAGIALNESMPLSGLFFIKHGAENRIKTIKPQKALERLLPVTSIPWFDRDIMSKILDFCEDLVFNVPAYEIDFTPSVEVVDVFEKYIAEK